MSTSRLAQKSRTLLIALIATLCFVFSTISAVHINGADITAQTDSPALAAGLVHGTGRT